MDVGMHAQSLNASDRPGTSVLRSLGGELTGVVATPLGFKVVV